MSTTYTITDDNFETVAKGVTLQQAARIAGCFVSTLESYFAQHGCACIGDLTIEPVATFRRVRLPKPIFVDL